ncbi:hypothetical protein J2Y67_004110 [Neobacillus niacini]|nr:hypothetical protein [Neobacillus niacini]
MDNEWRFVLGIFIIFSLQILGCGLLDLKQYLRHKNRRVVE